MPIVTELSVQKKNPNRFNLFIDKNFFSGLSVNSVSEFGLYQGKNQTDEKLTALIAFEIEQTLFDRACNFLGRGLKSKSRVKRFLEEQIYKKTDEWTFARANLEEHVTVEKIINRLEKIGLVNDRAYSEAFVRDRMKFKPKSTFALRQELLAKGVDTEIADSVLSEFVQDENALLQKAYYKRYKTEPISKEDKKKIDFLRRKGFNWDMISKFIEENGDSAE